MNLQGEITQLRAVEPGDIDTMYAWENDPAVWGVSGTMTPFSRHTLERFIDEQQFDIYQTRQLRLVIETLDGEAVGALDLFEFDPRNLRAGVGILIHDTTRRGKGYASDALATACEYAHTILGLHQLWCGIGADNTPSLALFRRAGFTETGIRRDWLHTPEGFIDEIGMQKVF